MTDSSEVEVCKEVDYEICGDTIKMESTYLSVPDRHPVRQVFARYIYDEEGNLKEIISRYVNADRETSACHSYYNYDKNVQCMLVAGMGFEPHDLRVMSPTSYQAALPRDMKLKMVPENGVEPSRRSLSTGF